MKNKQLSLLLIMVVLLSLIIQTPVSANTNLKDIEKHWAKSYILQLVQRGAVQGNPDGTFLPNDNISRAAFVKIITVSLGYELEEDKAFTDTQNHWASKFIGAAVREGLIIPTEYDNSQFEPNKYITRAEMARIVARALGEEEISNLNVNTILNFKDADKISEEFKGYIALTVEKGIITGYTDGSFGPNENATRAQASTMIVKLLNVLENESKNDNSEDSITTIDKLEPEEIYALVDPSVFYLEVYDDSGNILGTGSGFIVESSGVAVTNFHVIERAYSAKAFLSNGEELEVSKVLNYDKYKDIAILQLKGDNLPAITIGDSDQIIVGQKVLAIGSPQGLENTISNGIISSKERIIHGQRLIQTTTPISPGSSGGALLNYFGEVIGVTTLYIKDGQNLNFAIPINEVKNMLSEKPNPQKLNDIDAAETLAKLKGKVVSVRFYESGDENIPEAERKYSNKFPVSTTRYINWEIKLKYPEQGHHTDIFVRAVHYNPDGSYDGEYTIPYCIEEDWKQSTHTGGWGYAEPGLWDSGEYKLELYIGGEKVVEEYFEIYDDLNSFSALNPKAGKVEFFESDQYIEDEDFKDIKTKFEISETRYVNWLLPLEHLAPKQDIDFEITYIYYDPEGNKIADFTDEFMIEKGETLTYFYGGVGSVIPGRWETGKYKVELFVEDQLIAEEYFEITDNFSLSSIDGKVVEISLFEYGENYIADDVEFTDEFRGDKTRYVYWRVAISHKELEEFIGYPIKAVYYNPDGSVLGEKSGYCLFIAGPTQSYGFGNFGWNEPGNWEKGVYKIELYIGNDRIGEKTFEIY